MDKPPIKEYRFHVYDGLPYVKYQALRGAQYIPRYKDYAPTYYGVLRGINKWDIQEELNKPSQTAHITISPTTIVQDDEYEKVFLQDGTGKFVTTGGARILVSQVKTSRVEDTTFLDSVIDYGTVIHIEAYKGDSEPETVFWGVVNGYETPSKTQNVILRCVSVGYMFASELAAPYFQNSNNGYQIDTYNVDGQATRGKLTKEITFDKWRFFFVDPIKIMYFLIFNNPFAVHGQVINNKGDTSSWENPDDIGGVFRADIVMEGNTVGDILEKCMSYLSDDWFLDFEYIDTRSPTDTSPDIVLKINLKQSNTTGSGVITYSSDYIIHNNVEVIDYDINVTGANSTQDVTYASASRGELLVREIPNPETTADPILLDYRPQFREVTDDDNNVIGHEITDASLYVKRIHTTQDGVKIVGHDPMGNVVALPENPSFRDKDNKVRFIWWAKQIFKTHSATRPNEIATIRAEQGRIIQALALNDFIANYNPKHAGKVTIVDSDRMNTEDYKMGDVVGFRGFDNIIDYIEVRIVGKSSTQNTATLDLSFVLPTTTRRIQSLINDLQNANDI